MAAPTTSRDPVLSALEILPLIVLDLICEYVAHSEPRCKRRSLLHFALASKRCCEVADRQRFETVRITVKGPKTLRSYLKAWDKILKIGRREKFVRRVEVQGFMQQFVEGQNGMEVLVDDDSDHDETGDDHSWNRAQLPYQGVEYDEQERDEDLFWVPTRPASCYIDILQPLPGVEDQKRGPDAAWMPLAQFLARLPAIKELVYGCTDQVPMCILSSLHQNIPGCRLHITRFGLRSLFQSESEQGDIDPDELELIKSPCLHTIEVACYDLVNDSRRANYNQEAVLEMISGLSPGLRAVHMSMQTTYSGVFARSKAPWRGFLVADAKTGQKPTESRSRPTGQVQVLSIAGNSLSPGQITTLGQHTDFSQLRTLQLDPKSGLSIGDIRTLTRIAEATGFKSLRVLSLSTHIPDHRWPEAPAMDEATALLLRSLPPLKAIKLTGLVLGTSFAGVISHHSHTLQKLCFLPERDLGMSEEIPHFTVSARHMESLAQRSANLEDVEVVIPRTKGDKQELAIYRALSRMPRLKHLSLWLEFAPLAMLDFDILHSEENMHEFEGYVRECFVNAAVDMDLALAIFRAVSGQSNSLQKFTLGLHDKSYLNLYLESDGILDSLIRSVGRRWTVMRKGVEDPKIKRINNPPFNPPYWVVGNDPFRDAMYRRIWGNIWPESLSGSGNEDTDDEDWWKHWHSIPFEDSS